MGCLDAELSVTLTDDAAIADLAGRYGRPRRPTDVLAFALAEGEGAEYRGAALGDVVISLDTAARQATARRTALDRELEDLMIHGVLHLLGMDHGTPAEARNMRALESHLRWTLDTHA